MERKKSPTACDDRASKANFNRQPAHHSAFAPQSQYQSPATTTPKSRGRSPRAKGNRAERALVRLSPVGVAGGSFIVDPTVPLLASDHVVEVKVRPGRRAAERAQGGGR